MHASAGIGRVGGLAVALGVGAVVVIGGCAVAGATSGEDATSTATAPGAGPAVRSHARPPALRSPRPASVATVAGRAVAAASTAPTPTSPVQVIGDQAVLSAANVIARSQPLAPAAAVSTAATGSRRAAASADANPIATLLFNQTPTMTPAADAPLGRVVTGQLNGVDPDSAPLSYTVVTPPASGSVSIDANGNYTYTPYSTTARIAYTDNFTVSVSDADTGFHIHGLLGLINMLTFGLLGDSGHTTRRTVSVSVPGGNVAPTATLVLRDPDPVTGLVAGAIIGSDADADPLTYAASVASNGSVSVNPDGTFTYAPTPQARHDSFFNLGPAGDAFVIDVNDGYGGVATVPVSVGIAPAGVTFTFLSYDSGWTIDAQGAMNLAARSLASYFVVNAPMTITLDAITDDSDPNNLAHASAEFANGPNGFFYTVPQSKVITGNDANGPTADALVSFNWSQPWYLGDPSVPGIDSVPSGQYDFKAVAIHELLHAVGFLSGAQTPLSADRSWTVYDSFLVDASNNAVINPGTKAVNAGKVPLFTDPAANGGLYFKGSNAGKVRLYTPNTWKQGSSVSHVNELAGYVMNPSSGTGNGTRQLNPVEAGILKDIGYQISTSPWVPAFVLVFFRLRRRRR